MILFEPSPTGIGRLEMYDTREGLGINALKQAGLRKADKRVIRLADCLSVTPAPGESCPSGCAAFYLNTTQRTYTLAGPKQDEWVPVLCQLAFQVKAAPGGGGVGEGWRQEARGVNNYAKGFYSFYNSTRYIKGFQSRYYNGNNCVKVFYAWCPNSACYNKGFYSRYYNSS